MMLSIASAFVVLAAIRAGDWPREMVVYRGSTPNVDGRIEAGEYNDATVFLGTGTKGWNAQFSPTTIATDLSLKGWVKHDGEHLYFAFDITDDVIYGHDTERWLHERNPNAHELTQNGWPWFGDGIEILINAAYQWSHEDGQNAAGAGSSWQMVCSTHKSRLDGLAGGGLIEGEPRSKDAAWANYQQWILSGSMKAAVRIKPEAEGSGYVIEWKIDPNPCLEVEPGKFWNPSLGPTRMGLNLAVADLDHKETGEGNFGNFHHEDWWAGEKGKRTWLKQWGTLVLMPDRIPRLDE